MNNLSLILTLLSAALVSWAPAQTQTKAKRPPNIIYMLADDLGYGELGCYGQKKIRTPHVDRLSAEGMRFTRHYAGAPVCAPSRCVLMTGRHLSNAAIRGNKAVRPEGQWAIPDDTVTIADLMKAQGYATGAMGKWGLGPPQSPSSPENQGFDLYHGYICQRVAHNYYPTHLWLNGHRQILNNRPFRGHKKLKEAPKSYTEFYGNEYAPDLMMNTALAFIRQNQEKPFFLYLPFVEPHLAMQPPQEWVDKYPRSWDEEPYIGNRGYLPHPRPRAGYAAMISDLDDHVGRVMALLGELGLDSNTLVMFSSDNGATHDVGGVDTTFFKSVGELRGRKGSVYEGGLRVPMIARWPGVVEAGRTTNHVSGFQDVLPTLVELAGGTTPLHVDGISFLPTLLGTGNQKPHDHLIWEFFGYGGQQCVISGKWKAVRQRLRKGNKRVELYDLDKDPSESVDLAAKFPDVVKRLTTILETDRTPNADFPIKMLDQR